MSAQTYSKILHYALQTGNLTSASKFSCCSSLGTDGEGFPDPKFPTSFYEHSTGRLFYKKTGSKSHFLPCDDEEIERRQINYYLFKTVFGKTVFPQIEDDLNKGIRVLSVKAGPGYWINDMAEKYPNSHFTGTDLFIFPLSNPPRNCHYCVANAGKRLPFPDNTFDFVVQHDSALDYTQDEWTTVIDEIVRVTKPGGWIQFVESAGLVRDIGPNLSIWLMRVTVSLQTRNIVMKMGPKIHEVLETHNDVEDVESGHRSFPIAWLGKLGDLGLEATERLIDSMKPRLCEDWSMIPAKYDKMTELVAKECREFGAWSNLHYAIGRKKIVEDATVL